MLEPGMQLLYREEVASILKGESPMSCHHSLPPAAKIPREEQASRGGAGGGIGRDAPSVLECRVSRVPLLCWKHFLSPEACQALGAEAEGQPIESQPEGHTVTL